MTPVYSGDVQQVHGASLLWALPFLPAAGAAVLAVLGPALQRRYGARAVATVGVGCVVAAAAVAAYVVWRVLLPLPTGERFLLDARGALVAVGAVKLGATLALDPLAATFVLVITLAGALVQIYATGYMAGRPGLARFFCYVDLSVASALLLVLADNFLLMLVGWEGLGLCSYLLIGFHYGDRSNTDAARRAFIVNYVGDMGLLAGVALLL